MLGWKVFGSGVPSLMAAAICQDTATSVSAAGTTQGTATELTSTDNEVTTVGSGAGVVLSSKLAPGDEQTVFNGGVNPLKVYPTSGMKINNLAADSPMLLSVNTGVLFKCISTTRVFGVLSA
jgi:hypothetical protein